MNKLILWLILWSTFWLVHYFILQKIFKVNHTRRFFISIVYFFIISICTVFYFSEDFRFLFNKIDAIPVSIFILGLILNFLIYKFVNKHFTKPSRLINKFKTVEILSLNTTFLLSKSFEILYQQIYIWLLIIWLNDYGFNGLSISLMLSIMFGIGHLLLFAKMGKLFTLIYSVAAVIASFMFPYLVMNVNYGFLYSYILHTYFYTFLGVSFWVFKLLKKNK